MHFLEISLKIMYMYLPFGVHHINSIFLIHVIASAQTLQILDQGKTF